MGTEAGFEFVEGATSDLAFMAFGPTLEAVFVEAGRALLAATVEEPATVEPRERRTFVLREPDLELLLIRYLNELVYLVDAEELLLQPERVEIVFSQDHSAELRAELVGERIDRRRHTLASDVKAATAHGLQVAETAEGWTATATLDV
jgi:SHS2 domain-containing protein